MEAQMVVSNYVAGEIIEAMGLDKYGVRKLVVTYETDQPVLYDVTFEALTTDDPTLAIAGQTRRYALVEANVEVRGEPLAASPVSEANDLD